MVPPGSCIDDFWNHALRSYERIDKVRRVDAVGSIVLRPIGPLTKELSVTMRSRAGVNKN